MTERDIMGQLKVGTRQHIRLVWQLAQMGGALSEEDQRTVKIMQEHPEYAHLWSRLDQLSDAEITADGTDPILHITIHGMLEDQIAAGDPPELGQVVDALMSRGLSRHEAIHRAGMALMDEVWHVMREQRPYDAARYRGLLLDLLKPESRPRGRSKAHVRRVPGRR